MSVVENTPKFTLSDVNNLAGELYGLVGTADLLPSERDQNFLINCDSGKRFVFKIANPVETHAFLEAQNQAMEHVAGQANLFPQALTSLNGRIIETVILPDGNKHFVRLLTYLDGKPMGSLKRHSPELMFDFGRKLGVLDHALQGFDHPSLHREFHWDFANGLNIVKKNIKLVPDKNLRTSVLQLVDNFENLAFHSFQN